ncbi:MAG: LptF/LptG family permease [Verrucomicrobiota bacterium]
MKIARKYLLAEMTGPFLVGLASFTMVVLLHRFARLADLVIARGVSARLVGRLLLAVLLALGRLSADSETTALAGAGMGMRAIAVPVLIAGGITFCASLLVVWRGIPWGYRETQRVLANILAERTGAGVSEHVFREIARDVVVYPDRVSPDGQRLYGVFLSFRAPDQDPLLVFAREGRFASMSGEGAVGLELFDGTIHGDQPAKRLYRVASFGRMEFRVPTEASASQGSDDPKAMTLPQLSEMVRRTGGTGRFATYRYHFHRRLSLALSCLSFALLAIPLGMAQRARAKSSAFGITVVLVIVYYLFIAVAGMLERRDPQWMIAFLWAPNVLGLSLSAWILWRSEQRMQFLPARLQALLARK